MVSGFKQEKHNLLYVLTDQSGCCVGIDGAKERSRKACGEAAELSRRDMTAV